MHLLEILQLYSLDRIGYCRGPFSSTSCVLSRSLRQCICTLRLRMEDFVDFVWCFDMIGRFGCSRRGGPCGWLILISGIACHCSDVGRKIEARLERVSTCIGFLAAVTLAKVWTLLNLTKARGVENRPSAARLEHQNRFV
jgi:hypothetical protein